MLYCKSCRVWVAGAHQRCPLCGGNLSGKREEAPSYPELPENRSFTKRLIQIISGDSPDRSHHMCRGQPIGAYRDLVVTVRCAGLGLRMALGGGRHCKKGEAAEQYRLAAGSDLRGCLPVGLAYRMERLVS